MDGMSQQSRPADDAARDRRKRVAEKVLNIFGSAAGIFWLLVFIVFMRTGYLSWIGIAVGALYVTPGLLAPLVGLAGKKRLEGFLNWLSIGEPTLVALVVAVVSVWPERDESSWRPYSFNTELAAIEARRAVLDQNNAALRYESVLAAVDVNGRPDSVFRGGSLRCELAERPWKGEHYPEAFKWLDSYATTIDALLEIGRMEKCQWPLHTSLDCEWRVPYDKLRYSVQLLTAAGNRDLGEGRRRQALEKYRCLLQNANHMYQQTLQLDFWIGLSHERVGLRMIRHVLVGGESSEDECDMIARCLPPAASTWHRDAAALVEFNTFRFAQFMAQAYEINAQGKTRFARSFRYLSQGSHVGNSAGRGRAWRLYWLINMPLDPHDVWDMAREGSTELWRFLESGPVLSMTEEDENSFVASGTRLLANMARSYAHGDCFGAYMYVQFGCRYADQMSQRRGTWLVLGLRRYRDIHGVWPATLDEITQYIPPEAFSDPTSGEAFVYVRDNGDFRLYSKGPNGIDEGGRHGYVKALDKSEDDIPLWPPPVMEPEREPSEEEIEEMRQQFEEMFGKDYAEALFKDDGNDKR